MVMFAMTKNMLLIKTVGSPPQSHFDPPLQKPLGTLHFNTLFRPWGLLSGYSLKHEPLTSNCLNIHVLWVETCPSNNSRKNLVR